MIDSPIFWSRKMLKNSIQNFFLKFMSHALFAASVTCFVVRNFIILWICLKFCIQQCSGTFNSFLLFVLLIVRQESRILNLNFTKMKVHPIPKTFSAFNVKKTIRLSKLETITAFLSKQR